MEPRQEGVPVRREVDPTQVGDYQHVPHIEQPLTTGEQYPSRIEVGTAQAEATQVAVPSLPTPVVPQANSSVASDNTPIVANDDDLIEKEWVDKAKKILSETKDDPYKREREISALQVEYIRRRYGREIGGSGE